MIDAVEDMSTLTRTFQGILLLGRMHWSSYGRNAEIKHGISKRLWRGVVERLQRLSCNLEHRTLYHGQTKSRQRPMAARPEILESSSRIWIRSFLRTLVLTANI